MYGGLKVSRTDVRLVARDASHAYALNPLPLRKGYFDKIDLEPEEEDAFEHMMMALLEHAIDKMQKEKIYGGLDQSWRDIGSTNGFKRFTKEDEQKVDATTTQTQHYRVQGIVRTPMLQLMSAFDANNDTELVERRKFLFGDALDGQTLHVIKSKTPEQPHLFLGIRWEAINITAAADTEKRDLCVVEFVGVTADHDGHPLGFKISHSISIPQVPSLRKEYGLVRMEGTEVCLLRSTRNNHHTEVILEVSANFGKPLPPYILNPYLATIAANLHKLPVTAQNRRLSSMPLLPKSQWVPASERKSCSVCLTKFGFMSKKHHCRVCGEVTCKSCIVFRNVMSKTEKDAEEEVKFCKKCIIIACNHEDTSSMADSVREGSLLSASSTSSGHLHAAHARNQASRLSQTSSSCSSSVYLPTSLPKTQHELKLMDELNKIRDGCNSSLTASESSFDSSPSFMDPQTTTSEFGSYYSTSVDEDNVLVVDTKDMLRNTTAGTTSLSVKTSGTVSHPRHSLRPFGTATASPEASFQHMEESIAQQRFLLQEMMSRARSYQHTTSSSM